jgi:glycerol transport system permease protein
VAFSAVIPLMTVVNYSVNDTFGENEFFWNGLGWFEDMITSDRMHDALGRQVLFSAIILAIEVPLGIFIALNMPKKGFWASFCLVLMALPLLIPFNVVGTIVGLYLLVVGVTGLQLMGAETWVSQVFNGVALVVAVVFAQISQRRSSRV